MRDAHLGVSGGRKPKACGRCEGERREIKVSENGLEAGSGRKTVY